MKFIPLLISLMIYGQNLAYAQTPPNSQKIACDQQVLLKLVEKGFMNKNTCYSFDLKKNKMDVVINGAIYKLGDYSLDGTRKADPVMQSFKTEVLENQKNPSKKASDPIGEANVKKITEALKTLGIFVKQISEGVTKRIEVNVKGYADGVRNTMKEFDDPKRESDLEYKEALKDSATVDEKKSKILSEVRNIELATYRAKVHLNYLQPLLPTNVITTALGESSPLLTTGKLGCQGYCKYRRGAKIEIMIPGLEAKFSGPKLREIYFSTPPEGYVNLGMNEAKVKNELITKIQKNCSPLFTVKTCKEMGVKFIKTDADIENCVGDYLWNAYKDFNKNIEVIKQIRSCLSGPDFINFAQGMTPDFPTEIMKYENIFAFAEDKRNSPNLTVKDLKITNILLMEANFQFNSPEANETSTYMFKDVREELASFINSSQGKAINPFLVNIDENTEAIKYDINKVSDPYRKNLARGFMHTACGSGIGMAQKSNRFSIRTYYLVKGNEDRHIYSLEQDSGQTSPNGNLNLLVGRLYDLYETKTKKFNPTNIFSLQHPTGYLIKGCQQCGCIKNLTGTALNKFLSDATRLDFFTEFNERDEKGKFPRKTITNIQSFTGGQASCLFLPPLFVAHNVGEGSGAAEIFKAPEIPPDASCQELVKLIDKMEPVPKSKDSPDSILKHCTTFSGTNFPWTQEKCLECTKKIPIIDCKQTEMLDVTPGSFCD